MPDLCDVFNEVVRMKLVLAALPYFCVIGEKKFQRMRNGRKGNVIPGDVVFSKQFDFKAFETGRIIEIEQRCPVK